MQHPHLGFTIVDGRLVGRYAEPTLQGVSCGATGVERELVLGRE